MASWCVRRRGRVADGAGAPAPLVRPVTLGLLLALGIAAFVGMLLLAAYKPDLDRGGTGGHALSNAATGFSGLMRLAEATGRNPRIVRDKRVVDTDALLVVTPPSGFTAVGAILSQRLERPTLMVLPKWRTAADPAHRGWVRHRGLVALDDPEAMLAPAIKLHVARHPSGGRPLAVTDARLRGLRFTAPRPLQVLSGSDLAKDDEGHVTGRLRPLLTDGAGAMVLAQVDNRPLYVLADPDLLANIGLRDARNAASALALLDALGPSRAKEVAFDVTLNGLGGGPSPLRLLFEPPFLAVTLALAAVLLLAGLQTVTRFGRARRRERAIAFGKAALVDNTALLVRKAGRATALGPRYADAIRDAAVRAFGVPARLHGAAADAWLDRMAGRASFSDLVRELDTDEPGALVAAARRLHGWLGRRDA